MIGLDMEIRENPTDIRFIEFIENVEYTEDDSFKFSSSIFGTEYSLVADKILTFISEYKDGILIPDKWGLWEPLKNVFDVSEKRKYISKIACPSGEIYMLKKRNFDIIIRNRYVMPINGQLVLKRPEYLCEVVFWFSKLKALDYDFLKTLLRDCCDYLGTSRGVMFDAETDEILLDLSNPERIGTHIVSRDPFALP